MAYPATYALRISTDRVKSAEVPTNVKEVVARFVRATGDGRPQTRWNLVVRLNAAGEVQTIEFLNRVFPPTSPNL